MSMLLGVIGLLVTANSAPDVKICRLRPGNTSIISFSFLDEIVAKIASSSSPSSISKSKNAPDLLANRLCGLDLVPPRIRRFSKKQPVLGQPLVVDHTSSFRGEPVAVLTKPTVLLAVPLVANPE